MFRAKPFLVIFPLGLLMFVSSAVAEVYELRTYTTNAGKLDASSTIDLAAMTGAGLVNRPRDGVRLLARGELSAKVTIEVAGDLILSGFNAGALVARSTGGTISTSTASGNGGGGSSLRGAASHQYGVGFSSANTFAIERLP